MGVADSAPLSSAAAALIFGTVTFATAALFCQLWLSGNGQVVVEAMTMGHQPQVVDNTLSMFNVCFLLWRLTLLGVVLLFVYVSENSLDYSKASSADEGYYDRDEFFFMATLIIVASLFTCRRDSASKRTDEANDSLPRSPNQDNTTTTATAVNKKTASLEGSFDGYLPRSHTEEWKGWMQVILLLSKYYGANDEANNLNHVLVSCYVWMTTFGHCSYFYSHGDYSLVRVLRILWRLGFLMILLLLTLGTTSVNSSYSACTLHAVCFFIVYGFMGLAKGVNYTKWGLRMKLLVWSLVLFVLLDNATLGWSLRAPMAKEWYYQASMNHWSALFGILFAVNMPVTALFFSRLETQASIRNGVKSVVGVVLIAACWIWVHTSLLAETIDYERHYTCYAVVPLLTYVYFRNITPWVRSFSNIMLRTTGQASLEMYVLHHHIWLSNTSDNGKKHVLALISGGYPKMNFLFVSVVFFVASHHVHHTTRILRDWVLPHNIDSAMGLRNLGSLLLMLAAAIVTAFVMRRVGLWNPFVVWLLCTAGGSTLFKSILSASKKEPSFSTTPRLASFLSGFVAILVIGSIGRHSTGVGQARGYVLPPQCDKAVLQGDWININVCDESILGSTRRQQNIASIGTCEAIVWGWQDSAESSHLCPFSQRHANNILHTLSSRNITFAGDSIVRHLYHASCRLLGDSQAGAYNTTAEKHSDYSRRYRDTAMEFRWAPYVKNITSVVLDVINQSVSHHVPDLMVIGGGAWDRLHMYNNEGEHAALVDAATLLKDLMKDAKVPIVWVSPTTMNSWALNTEQKRLNIREDQMSEFRDLYGTIGVYEAATFVLNGTSFTSSRANESYDGVHYPLPIYDGGAQILANAYDWLVGGPQEPYSVAINESRERRATASGFAGFFMLCMFAVAIFLSDNFFGLMHIVALFIPTVQQPMELHNESISSPTTRFWSRSRAKYSDHEDNETIPLESAASERFHP